MSKGHHVVLAGNPGHRGTMRDGDGGDSRRVSGRGQGLSLDAHAMETDAGKVPQTEGKMSDLIKGIGLCTASACGLHAAANWHPFLQSIASLFR